MQGQTARAIFDAVTFPQRRTISEYRCIFGYVTIAAAVCNHVISAANEDSRSEFDLLRPAVSLKLVRGRCTAYVELLRIRSAKNLCGFRVDAWCRTF
jgi:hypothetical protein